MVAENLQTREKWRWVNVHAPNRAAERRVFWRRAARIQRIQRGEGERVGLMGDWNSVYRRCDRWSVGGAQVSRAEWRAVEEELRWVGEGMVDTVAEMKGKGMGYTRWDRMGGGKDRPRMV